MSVGRRAWRPEQPVEGLLGGETVMVLSRLSWVTGAVLGVPGVQVLWITVDCAIDSISSFVPCVHIERPRAAGAFRQCRREQTPDSSPPCLCHSWR